MNRRLPAACFCAVIALALGDGGVRADSLQDQGGLLPRIGRIVSPRVRALDAERVRLIGEIRELPAPAPAPTGMRLGWHSRRLRESDTRIELNVDLGAAFPIDLVALLPASGESDGFTGAGYGFPVRFRVEVADDARFTAGEVVGDFTQADVPNPGAFPFLVAAGGQRGRFVRVVITRAWPRREDWVVALGELMVISGNRNVAARRPASTASPARSVSTPPAWDIANLTDEQSTLGPPVDPSGSPTNGFLGEHSQQPPRPIWVQVDLGRLESIDEVRLLPARPTDIPDLPGYAFPIRFRVELARDPDLSGAVTLYESAAGEFPPPGENAVTLRAGGLPARVIRVTALEPYRRGELNGFALAELQAYSGNRNVARGSEVSASDVYSNPMFPRWRPEYLVDGYNSRHPLLELPVWLNGLDRRRRVEQRLVELGREEQVLVQALAGRFLQGTSAAVLVLVGGIGVYHWRARTVRRREAEALRAQIAGDLHDDIGSQLGSIALAAQLAARHLNAPAETRQRLAEIEALARGTADSIRDIVWLMRPGGATLPELVARMRETTTQQLAGSAAHFRLVGNIADRPLDVAFARNVILFLKEAVENAVRHAQASAVTVEVHLHRERIVLEVRDDGTGFEPRRATTGMGLQSLQHRANALGARFELRTALGHGTSVRLDTPIR